MQIHHVVITAIILFPGWILPRTMSAEPAAPDRQPDFADSVRPFLQTYCVECHGSEKQEGKLDLSHHSTSETIAKNYRLWDLVLERLEAKEMPPEEASRHPAPEVLRDVIDSLQALRRQEAQRRAGDPGRVLPRRLSNAEYDYTIRDLTGVDIRPTREFPIDPANEAGFDNSGESLAMSPALFRKYLAAARSVADHIVLKPKGFVFAPHPAVTDTDRDKYCVHRIVDFYRRQKVDYADYFLAAWQYKHRHDEGKSDASLVDVAAEAGVSAKYLTTLWSLLTRKRQAGGPLGDLQGMWRELPEPNAKHSDAVRSACEEMRDFVNRERLKFVVPPRSIGLQGISRGSQPLVLWENRQLAEHRMKYHIPETTSDEGDQLTSAHEEDIANFCEIFPDTFFVSQRDASVNPANRKEGRLLSAGFHLMVGYFRDDQPLYRLILDEQRQQELDALWQELDFITFAPVRQYRDFIFFERAEPRWFMRDSIFDFARAEDKNVSSEAMIRRLAEVYLTKARLPPESQTDDEEYGLDSEKHGGRDEALQAIEEYFTSMSARIRRVERSRLDAHSSHVEALQDFSEKAFRRPLTESERSGIPAFYQSLREEGLNHEDAVRDVVVSTLMSPWFCYRADLPQAGRVTSPLSDYDLASRLSYFLWASLPDDELLSHAAAGDLHRREVLLAQTRRMLRDQRVRGMATEFGGHWLDFRRFEQHNSVDRRRFKSFTNKLRKSMYEEPLRFFVDLVQRNGSILDFIYGDYTIVDAVLAEHYGMPSPNVERDDWVRIEDARRYGRGGLLPMSVFLTSNSPGLRTSPVKRGYWVVRRVLGQHIPPPPPNVPELPEDEAQLGDLSLRQIMARHRNDPGCAGCHDHFDSIGLVFEDYGPIGERREEDLGGRPVDTRATFPGGDEGTGLDGLRLYLSEHRQDDFVDNLCRRLLAYALGRSLLLSDEAAIQNMRDNLADQGFCFSSLVETIVTSPQFLNKRGRDYETEH
ncbi:MAG: DUF1592 domain-containing protein [Fuerstiella sp.]|nr:DUF1592 domain-containing protein [Fuerstiella sp.]